MHAFIVGEHGDSEFPLWSGARLGPVPILDWRTRDREPFSLDELDRIAEDVRTAAYRVIAGKGATNYAIGLSAARIVEAILRDEHAILPVSSVLERYHDAAGVALSVPSVVGASGVEAVLEMTFDASEEQRFNDSAAAVADSVRRLGF